IPTRINVSKLDRGIVLNGDLSDDGWSKAERIETFVEYFKGDNAPPPVQTTALLTYDSQYVYVGFDARDPHPDEIRAPFVERDQVLADQDYVAVMIDTQNDRKSGIVFRVNPRGIQSDSVMNDTNGDEDFAPDFFFEAKARRTANGWTAELRIPLSSLRYPSSDPQTWAVMLTRNYPRDYRYVMANTPIPKSRNCFVCYAAELTGLTGLPTGGHLVLAPYTTANRFEHAEPAEAMIADPMRSDVGLDLKWKPSAKLTVDGTLNPDFSQIESDTPQVSVNSRFALDYPEKRTFFLEGVDLLSMPLRAVYTRAITSPAWGARATGELGRSAYTMLVSEDRGGGSLILPGLYRSETVPQDFRSRVFLGRLRTSFGSSFAGMLATTREIEGGGYNRVLGPDLLWKMTKDNRLAAQILFSDTENPRRPDLSASFNGQTSRGHAMRAWATRDRPKYDLFAEVQDTSPGFRDDNGFIPRVGHRLVYAEAGGHAYPTRGFFSYLRPYVAAQHNVAYDGGASTRRLTAFGSYFEGKWGSSGWISLRPTDGERVDGRMLAYRFVEGSLKAAPNRNLPLLQLEGAWGERVDYTCSRVGRGGALTFTSTVRPTEHLELAGSAKRDWVVDSYAANITRLKMTYSFDARSLVRLIGQHEDTDLRTSRDGNLSLSALYAYRLNWQTVFFVGYGDNRTLDERAVFQPSGRSMFLKVAYAFQR
ncbi:MAG: carbohydrate binding family 9 domain-containing protein, partial [Acidobacteria bacterium]|nr:carbohydrate binding family 9 domain-containing protein [Acidobacteriota bacterium]